MATPSWSTSDIPTQVGRTVLVTGGNSGLGLATAATLAERGARVFLGCRNEAKGKAALDQVGEVSTGPEPELLLMDLGERSSLAAAACDLARRTTSLDLLVNNAGLMTESGSTPDGDEIHFGTNHLGPFFLTAQLLPLLLKASKPRVVTISSLGHWFGRQSWCTPRNGRFPSGVVGYVDSKLANVMFALELDRRAKVANSQLISAGAHPGVTKSNLAHDARGISALMPKLLSSAFQEMSTGVLSHLRASTDPTLRGGEYIGQDRVLGLRGAPTLARHRRIASDICACTTLWEHSEAQTGATFRFDA
jgi:protochlorophyllide reductase